MAKLVFEMNEFLGGVDHMAFAPRPTRFRHIIEETQEQAGRTHT